MKYPLEQSYRHTSARPATLAIGSPPMPLCLVVLLLVGLCGTASAAERIEVLPLQVRSAQELIPIIKPLAGPGSTVTGMGDRLVIKAEGAQIDRIRRLLPTLDRAPRRLMIEVRRAGSGGVTATDAGLAADPDGARARLRFAQTRGSDDTAWRVQGLEGYPAFIASGARLPARESSLQVIGGVPVMQQRAYYQNATGGFYVVPWLNGDRVTLTIQQRANRPAGRGLAVQQAGTTVAGTLGEWIELAGEKGAGQQGAQGIGHFASTRGATDQTVQVRVTALD